VLQDFAAIGSVRTTRPPHVSQRVGSARTKAWNVSRIDLRDRSSWRPSSAETCMLSLSILSRSPLEAGSGVRPVRCRAMNIW